MQWLRRTFPIARWLPGYTRGDLRGDVTAGVTVGVMLIPQSMAYAVIAGLPPIYGLYASLVPLLIYPLLGTSRHLAIGPIAIDMLIVAAGVGALAQTGTERYVALAIALAAMVGFIQIGMGAARMGFLVTFLSRPVIVGFTSAAAFIITFSQLGNLLGVELRHSQYIYVLIWDALQHADQVHWLSLGIGVAGIALILSLQHWKPFFPASLAVVVLTTLLTWGLHLDAYGLTTIGEIPTGLPLLALPDVGAGDLRRLLPTALTLALVQFMTVISLGRVFSARYRYAISANRELVAIGASNLIGSLFRSIPVSSSFSRSAVNDQAGARTALANVVAASLIVLTLLFLTPLFYYLPLPALAAIIIVAAIGLVDVAELRYLFQTKERDGVIAFFTFGTTIIVGIQEGILLGIAASTVGILYRFSRPHVAELGHLHGTRSFRNIERAPGAFPIERLLILRVDASFSFFNAKYFKNFILEKSAESDEELDAVIIDGTSINDLDTTAIEALREVVGTLNEWGIDIFFTGLKGPVREVIRDSGLLDLIGTEHFYRTPHRAVEYILAKWDAEEGSDRLDSYRKDLARKSEAEVEDAPEFNAEGAD